MKKIIGIILLLVAFAFTADYKPFTFDNIPNNDSAQQTEFDYMLQYKLWGTDYIQMGHNIKIPDKSGWNGSRGTISSDGNGQIVLGGPVLTSGDINMGMDSKFTTGPVRANTFNSGVRGEYAGNICLVNKDGSNVNGTFSCDSVPEASTTLKMPTIVWPEADSLYQPDIKLTENNQADTIYVPEGEGQYDVYFKNIWTCIGGRNGCKIYVKMEKNRLTRIFVDSLFIGNHTTISVILGDEVLPQNKYKGNVLIYSNKDIIFDNTDNVPIQGSFITTSKIYLKCNLDFAGQLLANQLEIGNDFKGENFRFVKFDPDTLDFPELDKQAGLRENDSTVIIPIQLSDTSTIDVYFTYCFDLKDGVTLDDFNQPPYIPICDSNQHITTKIPIGSKTPADTIKVNVKKDTIIEPNDYLILHIDSISGAVLPNGETSGELKIKITDAETKNTSIVLDKTDTIKSYQEELRIPPGTGVVGNIKYTDDGIAPLIWSIEDPSGLFTVVDGVIKTNHVFDYETEDTTYVIKVKVADGKFLDSANYLIKIVNVQEPITITGKVDKVNENSEIGTPIGVINGKDADSTAVSYTINTTDFKIDQLTGVITTNTLLDFETKDSYPVKVTITSTDGSKKDTTFTIYVNDVDEPVHAHDTTIIVKENTTGIIGIVTGEDEDGKPVKFYSNDTLHYVVDSITGTIRLVEPFDYETTKNDTLKVIVKDVNGNTDTVTVAIEIKNVNEPPVLQPNDSLTVPENCKSCIVGIITATDPDKDTLTYTVKEPGFSIDSNGVLKLTEPIDFEKNPEIKVTVIVKDPSGAGDTAVYTIKVTDINEPVHTKDTTCSVKENYTGNVCKITGTDEDKTPVKFIVTDTTNYSIDSTGQLVIKNPIDYENKTKDTVKVIVTDGEFSDTASIIINIIDEKEDVKITAVDNEPKKDTIKTNDPNHNIEWKLCEGIKCDYDTLDVEVHKDTTIKVCNEKKTVCDSVVILFNDAPPVVTLTNAKSTDALIDYITIEEEKDDKIYVNKKNNEITVTVKDTVHKTEKYFNIDVTLDTVATKDIKLTEYNYIIDETKAKVVPIGNNLAELVEVIKVDGVEVELKQVIDTKTGKPVDTVQTVTYTKKLNGKDVVVSYKTDNLTGQKIGDYEVSYMIDSCTKVTYSVDDNKKIVKNKEGNIAYTIAYEYTDDYGNKASAKVEIIFDDIPPKVEILNPTPMESFNTNAIPVKWTVNGEVQDTLTLQRLEKGINHIIRRYVDKAGNVAEDTITVIMREAKDIDITLVHPVTKVDKDKVDEYYSEGHKYNDKKPYDVKFVDPKNDTLPETIGVGFKVDIVLPSVSPTGSLATLDDIVKNGMIPVDDKGNIVGASTKGIPVETYVAEHCTDEFKEDYKKNGLNIPLYDVTYNLHLWVYTNNANYVNDFNIEFTLNDEAKTTSAGTVQMVIDWLSDKDGNVKAKNGHALGTGAYITKLWSKSLAKHRCDYKEQKKGDRTVKKDDTMKVFGYKRPNDK